MNPLKDLTNERSCEFINAVFNLILTGWRCHYKSIGHLYRGRKESPEKWREEFPRSFPED